MKLKVSTFEQEISSASLGRNNHILITNPDILNAFEPGVTINPSIFVTYSNSAFPSSNIVAAGTPYVLPPPTTWVQRGADIDGEANSDQSGTSVSLSSDGTIVAIGAIYNAGGGYQRGHVRVYAWNGATSTWGQRGADIDGETNENNSGYSVSLSSDGTTLAISAKRNAGGGYRRGHVRVYAWNGATSTWGQRGNDIDGEADNDESGDSVSLSSDGTIVAIGARVNANYRGHVRVYKWNETNWVQRGNDIDGETNYDRSGTSVSLSADGSFVAIGAPENAGGGSSRGHVRVYAWIEATSTWGQRGADIDGEADGVNSGTSVSLSSNGLIVAISAINAGGGGARGHVRVYTWNGATWVQRGNNIDGETNYDRGGDSVSLSSDGSIVAIGAHRNPGGGGASSSRGHVRVYTWNGATWGQRGADIDGEADNDQSGTSVSLSSNGSIVAIGARLNANYRGHVRVYKFQ